MQRQWLITGCSAGLGLELARAALEAGQKVIASSRNPEKTPELVAEFQARGGQWIALDTTDKDLEKVIAETAAQHGPIEVLVNNAGYAIGGPLETVSIEAIQQLFATNVYGPIRTMQAVLPSMRGRKAGTIVNVGSGEFWCAHAGISAYSASKFALEGISEALRNEVAGFGVRVLHAVPGDMRTSFVEPSRHTASLAVPEAYKETAVDYTLNFLVGMHGTQSLDPKRVAAAIVKEVLEPTLSGEGKPMLRMPLGKESLGGMRSRGEEFRANADIFESCALKCDFPE